MTTIYDAPVSVIKDVAEELKKIEVIKPPEWAQFVKTGSSRERKPENLDWWYVRSASMLRKIRIYGPIGIPTLRRRYGGKKNRGHNPEAMRRGSGTIIRNIVHQLEKAGLLKKTKEGRVATPKGISLLDKVSHKVRGEAPRIKEVEKDAGGPRGAKEEKAAGAPAKAARRKSERRAKAAN